MHHCSAWSARVLCLEGARRKWKLWRVLTAAQRVLKIPQELSKLRHHMHACDLCLSPSFTWWSHFLLHLIFYFSVQLFHGKSKKSYDEYFVFHHNFSSLVSLMSKMLNVVVYKREKNNENISIRSSSSSENQLNQRRRCCDDRRASVCFK